MKERVARDMGGGKAKGDGVLRLNTKRLLFCRGRGRGVNAQIARVHAEPMRREKHKARHCGHEQAGQGRLVAEFKHAHDA